METHEYVSVAEAAVRLRLSPTTIRERIRAGTLDAERVARPQGSVFMVKVPLQARDDAQGRTNDARLGTSTPEPPHTTGMAALVPFLAELASVRQLSDVRAERIAILEREAGTLEARAAHERSRAERAEAELASERAARATAEAERERLRRRSWWERLRNRQ